MYRFTIKGTVQGVGFRPHIYNVCNDKGLCGFVQNTPEGVIVEVDSKEQFEKVLENLPKNARVDSYDVEEIEASHTSFTIKKSEGQGYAEIPPDFFLCKDCLEEMNDEKNRRHKYFFTTCTNCGPRFTITERTPYDRGSTTMDEFPMCEECKSEFEDPGNRRYHAQTIACHDCGPELALYKSGNLAETKDNLETVKLAAEAIGNGEIVAIKGIGGFHLACNTNPEVVKKLKKVTGRTDKPFALLARDVEMGESVAIPNERQKELLESKERPIVLVPKRPKIPKEVSELDTVGVMLPYSALHYLLFDFLDEPIVLTSSNKSDEPITAKREEQAVDVVLDNTRKIENVADDSVVKAIAGHTFFLRRSRGFVPQSISVPKSDRNILALGAEMNNTFCVYKKEGKAILSQHMGNTSNVESFEHFKYTVDTFLEFTSTTPDVIVADLHPDYNTSRYGETLSEALHIPFERAQHHKAHAYGAALEHKLNDFVAIVADGVGHGEDGTVWGGEIFHNNERVGHLEQHIQIGGDSAAENPAKMLFSILRNFLSVDEASEHMRHIFTVPETLMLDKQREDGFNAPLSSSCGRVLDAASYLLGFCDKRTYDGRPAMLLEANSFGPLPLKPVITELPTPEGNLREGSLRLPSGKAKETVLMTTPLFQFLIENLDEDKKRLGATVQRYLAEGLYEIAKQYEKPIVWSGGCAYNTIMSGYMIENGVNVNKKIPAGDGGISFGQVAYSISNL